MVAQRDNDGPCKCGTVNNRRRVEGLGIRKRIRQNQAPFSVGVDHLDCLALPRPDDVARLHGPAVEEVLGRRHDPHDIEGNVQLADCLHRPNDGRTPGHVEDHILHAAGGFDRDPPRIEREPLPDQDQGRFAVRSSVVAQYDQAWFLIRSLSHGQERMHTLSLEFFRP